MSRILVIGATGTVGGEVAKQLAASQADVVCGLRNPAKLTADYPTVELDLTRPDTFAAAVEGVDRIFLVAPAFTDNAAELIEPLVTEGVKQGVTHVVYSSVMGAENDPEGSHRRVELAIEASGVGFTHLRPNFFMQNFLTYERANLDQGVIYLPTGDGATSYIDVVDIAAVAVAALTSDDHRGKTYTLTGPEALTHADIAALFTEVLGTPVTDVNPSPEGYAETLTRHGAPEPMVQRSLALYTFIRDGWCAPVVDDVPNILGRPATTFAQFAQRVFAA